MLEHRSGHLEWEAGSNRSFTVPKTAAEMLVEGHWGSTEVCRLLLCYRTLLTVISSRSYVTWAGLLGCDRTLKCDVNCILVITLRSR